MRPTFGSVVGQAKCWVEMLETMRENPTSYSFANPTGLEAGNHEGDEGREINPA